MNSFNPHCSNGGSTSDGPHSDQNLKCECSGCVEAERKWDAAIREHRGTYCQLLDCKHHDVNATTMNCGYSYTSPMPCRYYKKGVSYVDIAHRKIDPYLEGTTIKAYTAYEDVILAIIYEKSNAKPFVTVNVRDGYKGKKVAARLIELSKEK